MRRSPIRPTSARRLSAALSTLALLLATSPAAAQDLGEPPTPGTLWNGTHVGLGVSGGPAFLANDALADPGGFALAVQATAAMTMQVVHVAIFYTHAQLDASADGDAFSASSNALGGTLGAHPLFLANLLASRLGYVLASLYVGFGVSAEFTSSEWRGASVDESWELGTHIAAGLDVPLDSADDGSGFWLGFHYRRNSVPSASGALAADGSLESHVLLFSLGYRVNAFPLF